MHQHFPCPFAYLQLPLLPPNTGSDTKTLLCCSYCLTWRVWSSIPLPEKPSVCNGVRSRVSLLVFKTFADEERRDLPGTYGSTEP